MSSGQSCPKCGATSPGRQTLNGICPKCLLGAVFLPITPPEDDSLVGDEKGESTGVANSIAAGRRFGAYLLLNDIGRGGSGVVWRAQQHKPDRVVALKMLLFGRSASSNDLARFRREPEAVARLNHPNIVPVYEVGEHDGQPFFSMEHVEGPNLATLSGGRPIQAKLAADYIRQIALAVHLAHEHGVVHRDIKPSNILIDPHNLPRLTDFGLAQFGGDSDLTKGGSAVGSLPYAPPEQTAGKSKEVGPRSDVYALGATLYHLLTGRPPFVGESSEVIFVQVLNQDPVAPRELNPSVPRDLNTICLKCLEKSASRRYGSAKALAEDLTRFLAGEAVNARPINAAERLARYCRRRPLMGAGALFLAVAAGLIAYAVRARSNEATAKQNAEVRQFILNNQYLQLTDRSAGWYGTVSNSIPPSNDSKVRSLLREQLAGALVGMDARPERKVVGFRPTAVWKVPGGEKILISGRRKGGNGERHAILSAWDPATGQTTNFGMTDEGRWALGWMSNRTPVQVIQNPTNPNSYQLFNLATHDRQRDLSVPPEYRPDPSTALSNKPKFSLTPDGHWFGVAQPVSGRQGMLFVWDLWTDRLVFQTNFEYTSSVSTLAISPGGELLAAGMKEGYIVLWPVGGGRRWRALQENGAEIKSLRFHREARNDSEDVEIDRMLLAAIDAAGTVTVWDLRTQHPRIRIFSRSSELVEFSPDGSMVATGGDRVDVWNVANGRHLLRLQHEGDQNGIVFTEDQKQIVVADDQRDSLAVWRMDGGRGTLTLHGLRSTVSKLCISGNGRRLAAYSRNHEVAVWSLADGRLIRVWEVPHELKGTEAALAFTHDGSELAFASERTVKWWFVDTGQPRHTKWTLSPGIGNQLGFVNSAGTNSLVLFRQENSKPRVVPYPEANPADFPRVCRLYRFNLDDTNGQLVLSLTNFNHVANSIVGSPEGRFFVVDGNCATAEGTNRVLTCIDGINARELWTRNLGIGHPDGEGLRLDSAGLTLVVTDTPKELGITIDLQSGKGSPWQGPNYPLAMGPRGSRWVVWNRNEERGLLLFESARSSPALALGPSLTSGPSAGLNPLVSTQPNRDSQPLFSPDGEVLAVGQPEGSVFVFRLREIARHLSALGLDR